jgi:hypothetical protein
MDKINENLEPVSLESKEEHVIPVGLVMLSQSEDCFVCDCDCHCNEKCDCYCD